MIRPSGQDLGDLEWRLGYIKGGEAEESANAYDVESIRKWIDARVPGNVRDDLMGAGLLPDLYHGMPSREDQWVDRCYWWYEVPIPVQRKAGQRLFLDFRGIDYRSTVFWNQTRLGENTGMFTRLLYDVTQLTQDENVLHVRIAGSEYLPKPAAKKAEGLFRRAKAQEPDLEPLSERYATLKCQMNFGEGRTPIMRTMGIWDDVYLHVCGSVFIERLSVMPELSRDRTSADVRVRAAVNTANASEYTLEVVVDCPTDDAPAQTFRFPTYFQSGREVVERTITIANPALWNTWDRGTPHLYELRIRVLQGDELIDELVEQFGIRDVLLAPNPNSPPEAQDWTFVLNGEPMFLRGANWMPIDTLPGRLRADDYVHMLDIARSANINALRVWGGGLREKAIFYQRCAELGIAIWQEFPTTSPQPERYSRDAAFLALVEQEVGAIVKSVHNSPALIAYGSGNRFAAEGAESVLEVMRSVLSALDPERPFFESSPCGGEERLWAVWEGSANLQRYREQQGQVLSEFGLQAVPARDTMSRFLTPDAVWPPGEQWTAHGAAIETLDRYAKQMGDSHDLPTYTQTTQWAQALGLQVAIEEARRRKPDCSGAFFWRFNDSWPAISCSVIDYFRERKLAFETVRRSMQPVLASVRYPLGHYREGDRIPLEVWVINDTPKALTECRIEVYMPGEEGRIFNMAITVDEVPPDSAGPAFEFELQLPDRKSWILCIDIVMDDMVVSSNQYDLCLYDAG